MPGMVSILKIEVLYGFISLTIVTLKEGTRWGYYMPETTRANRIA